MRRKPASHQDAQLWQEKYNDFFQPVIFDAPDFLCEKNGNLEWIWRIKDEITEADTAPYEIIEHSGGLYAAAVSIDGDNESVGVIDGSRTTSVHIIYADEEIKKGLGYHQLNFYAPIKLRDDI